MNTTLQSLHDFKFHPFGPDVPIEALHVTPQLDAFIRRVDISIAEGGFVMISGEPRLGVRTVVLDSRRLAARRNDIHVARVTHTGGSDRSKAPRLNREKFSRLFRWPRDLCSMVARSKRGASP